MSSEETKAVAPAPSNEDLRKELEAKLKAQLDQLKTLTENLSSLEKHLVESEKYKEAMKFKEVTADPETTLQVAPKPVEIDPKKYIEKFFQDREKFEATYGINERYQKDTVKGDLHIRMCIQRREWLDGGMTEEEILAGLEEQYGDEIRALI